MKDQLNFGNEYVSEAAIIREHFRRLGKKGGAVSTSKKAAASRRNAVKALAARMAKREHMKKA